MNTFSFDTVSHIIVGGGACAALDSHLQKLGAFKKIAIITDAGIIAAGLIEPALVALKTGEKSVFVYDGVTNDPPSYMVRDAVKKTRAFSPDCIIGIGGGSTMDTAKLVAILCAGAQELDELYGFDQVNGERLPLVLVPTTAGTGSEVTPISVVTRQSGEKIGIIAPSLFADMVVLDPELSFGLPRHITAATGIDAMVHAIEAMTSARMKNPVSDSLALIALTRLHGAIERACRQGDDREARTQMLLGAMQAGQAFANAPVGAIHALAYPIGGQFHVSHGLSNALVMPHVMRFNAKNSASACQVYAQIYDRLALAGASMVADKAAALIDELERICRAIGLERHLTQVGIKESDLAAMADEGITIERLLKNNPAAMSRDDIFKVYEAAL